MVLVVSSTSFIWWDRNSITYNVCDISNLGITAMTSKTLDQLDDAYSDYIRLDAADNSGNAICCTCGTKHFWKYGDCGHFEDRRHMSTRYFKKNTDFQCIQCNRFLPKEVMISRFKKHLVEKYGEGVLDEIAAKKRMIFKISEREAKEMIQEFRLKAKQIKEEKGL